MMTFTDPASHAHDTEYIVYLALENLSVSPSDVPLKSVPLEQKGLTGFKRITLRPSHFSGNSFRKGERHDRKSVQHDPMA